MSTLTAYRACPIKRPRRTKADVTAIRNAIIEVIKDDPPMTVRQVFYQLVARGVIEKTEEQYQGTVIRLMTEMRLSGELPFHWVVDESRRVRITQTYDSIAGAIEHTAKFYRRSALAQAPDYLEIWCEKDALAGALWDVTSDYDVPLMISRGTQVKRVALTKQQIERCWTVEPFTHLRPTNPAAWRLPARFVGRVGSWMPSLTFLRGSAQAIARAAKHDKQSFIYQFGDHDPSGVLIPQTIERRLRDHPALIVPYGLKAITAVQLTLLRVDGSGKADVEKPKITIASPAATPMVIAPPNDLLGLAITEGVEDALSVHCATGLGAWASGGASFMPKLAAAVPSYIEAVTIYAHADEAGQRGAYELAAALDSRGMEIRIEGIRP